MEGVAIYTYNSVEEDELTFQKADIGIGYFFYLVDVCFQVDNLAVPTRGNTCFLWKTN